MSWWFLINFRNLCDLFENLASERNLLVVFRNMNVRSNNLDWVVFRFRSRSNLFTQVNFVFLVCLRTVLNTLVPNLNKFLFLSIVPVIVKISYAIISVNGVVKSTLPPKIIATPQPLLVRSYAIFAQTSRTAFPRTREKQTSKLAP